MNFSQRLIIWLLTGAINVPIEMGAMGHVLGAALWFAARFAAAHLAQLTAFRDETDAGDQSG
jgi:hypothetical protein